MKKLTIFGLICAVFMQFSLINPKEWNNDDEVQPTFHVALMMPFYLHTPEKRNTAASKAVYDYYEGMQMAFDMLKKDGFRMVLHVYDTEGDDRRVDSFFQLPEMAKMNTIFGPIYDKPHAVAEQFCSQSKIPLISPFNYYKRKNATSFPHINLNASDSIEAFGMGQGVGRLFPNYELYIVSDDSGINYKKRKLFKEGFQLTNFKTIKTLSEKDLAELYAITKTKSNIIVYAPTENVEVLNKLINLSATGKIKLVFAKDKKAIDGINKSDLIRGKVMFGDNEFYYMYDKEIVDFRKWYRVKFRGNANIWHFKGYDQFMWLGKSLMTFKQNYPAGLKTASYSGLVQEFSLKPVANGGYENSGCKVAYYDNQGIRREVK